MEMHRMKRKSLTAASVALITALVMAGYLFGLHHERTGEGPSVVKEAIAAETKSSASPVKALAEREVYFPNTEILGADEMRVIALGTGTPNFRRSQASASWLVELGNGEKFIFDVGTGSLANLGALEIPYAYLDKIFISHLHVDHIGDLDAMFIGGWVSNRTGPLRVWGPSGRRPELGTKYAVERMREMFTWDLTGRRGNMPSSGGHVEVTEFDYSKTHVIYEQNGVRIKAWPAIHTIDGSVSYSLEWKGKKFVYSGDTVPNKWFLAESRDADLLIHECYLTIQQFIDLKHYDPERARIVATVIHTPPSSCGKLFSQLQPRMAVAYHNFSDFNVAPGTLEGIRQTYDGPLTLADDLLVWNVNTDSIRVRRVIGTDEAWPATPPYPAGPPDPSERTEQSDWLKAGRVDLLK
jgi:ribonuclease Z